MAKSSPKGKQWTFRLYAELVKQGFVERVVDIGPGHGTYSGIQVEGQFWTAVEVWGPYVREFELSQRYDRVIVADARWVDWSLLGGFDLALCGDVMEHMEKQQAVELADRLLRHGRFVIISIPIEPYPQDEVNGNPFEVHVKDDWSHDEVMASFPDVVLSHRHGDIGVYCLARAPLERQLLERIAPTLTESA
ncbi:hypothetical protein JRI60_08605 [Archangium violaceum]|uniref:class I SAM-dependent methyltransferase n=1 Tax=Archangium violaceum TaxID=83451 RepID=UPI00194E41C6|nr:class I SAM-dependent methyltransferase [Archangium violaceum]QRN99064.1 hypothetical protein JRI60_08605 [Archangium violaceum]